MLFKDITYFDENFEIKEHAYIGIEGDIIDYIGESAPKKDYGEIYDGKGKLLLPAFYDLHSHLSMSLMRGYGENMPLMDWLQKRIFPFESFLNDNDIYYGCLMGVAEMLRFGIGCASDMYLSQKPVCRAFTESGIKGNVSACVICPGEGDYYDLKVYKDAVESIKEFDGADNGRVRAEISLHAEYTSTEKVARAVAETALKFNSSMHIHVSETAGEVADCRARRNGRSPVKYLADCGIFDVPTVAAHCVHIDDEDIEILKNKKVTVATCPKGNAKLSSGIAPVNALIKAGVNVGIGTDSVASNNNLNMIEEMRFFNLLQKVSCGDSTAITPKETLFASTRAGAIAQRRENCGAVKVGFKADLTVLDIEKVYMKPVHDLLNNLIYSAQGNDVVMTVVDGKILYRNGVYTTLDIEKITYECEKSKSRILSSLSQSAK